MSKETEKLRHFIILRNARIPCECQIGQDHKPPDNILQPNVGKIGEGEPPYLKVTKGDSK